MEVRWMMRSDLPAVVAIEQVNALEAWQKQWTEDDFLDALRSRDSVGWVVCQNNIVTGYMIYSHQSYCYSIKHLVIDADHRRQGFGRLIVNKLLAKGSVGKRKRTTAIVHERNLDAQMFFKRMGFQAHNISPGHFGDDDAYYFEHQLEAAMVER